jgi:hypothetical protein
MASTAQDMLEQVLEKGGFIQDGQMSSGLINAEIARTNATTDLRYRHLFNVSGKDGSVIDLVYEVPSQSSDIPGTPSIYFKLIEEPEPSSETIKNLRSLVWNQGHAPTLWLVTPTSVLIYNSYARPQKDDDEKSHLLEELKQIGGQVKLLDEFYKRNFDTGDFWQSKYGKKIDKRQRVDMAFMFSSALGWDRHLIEPVDWLQVRLPDSILNETDSGWVEILQREQWLREHWQTDTNTSASLRHEIAMKQEKLNQAIFQLYGLSEQEILLVEDTVQYGIKPILTKQLRTLNALAKATTNDLQTYAQRMCMQLDSILHYGSSELVATVIEFSQQLPLHVRRFTQKNLGNNKKVTVVRLNDIDDIIDQIAENLRTAIADHMYVQRSLHIYENDGFWIIKGAEQRLWCESAALNDADVVVREHMEAMVD